MIWRFIHIVQKFNRDSDYQLSEEVIIQDDNHNHNTAELHFVDYDILDDYRWIHNEQASWHLIDSIYFASKNSAHVSRRSFELCQTISVENDLFSKRGRKFNLRQEAVN
jgi:hypothetical protein